MQLQTAGLVVIKNRKLLLAFSKNKQAFYLPGGKTDEGETTKQGLIREINEELNILLYEEDLKYYTHITAPAFGESNGVIMEQDCFLCELRVIPIPAAEIGALEYFTVNSYTLQPKQVPGVVMILQLLKEDRLID